MSMKLEVPIIATMIAGLFFIGAFTIFSGLGQNYEDAGFINDSSTLGLQINNGSESIYAAMNRLNDTKEKVDQVNSNLTTLTPEFTSLFPFLKSVWTSGKILIDSLIIPRDIIIAGAQIIGLDTSIVFTLFSILLLLIIMSFIIILAGRVI